MNNFFSRLGVLLVTLIAYLPFPIIYFISDFLYVFIYYIAGYRKKVVRTNLLNSFPELSSIERLKIEKDFYHHLCDTIIETPKMISFTGAQIRNRIKMKNSERYFELINEGKSFCLLFGHYHNWEWISAAIATYSPINIFAIYKPLTSKPFDKMFYDMRAKQGITPLPMQTSMRSLMKQSKDQFGVIIVTDQTPSNIESSYWAKFLNQNTPIFLGSEKIAEHFDTAVIFVDINRVKRGYLEFEFVVLVESTKGLSEFEITELHTRYLEKRIIEKPAYWLWSHRRWKHQATDAIKTKYHLS